MKLCNSTCAKRDKGGRLSFTEGTAKSLPAGHVSPGFPAIAIGEETVTVIAGPVLDGVRQIDDSVNGVFDRVWSTESVPALVST
jgi:hypothetical protein